MQDRPLKNLVRVSLEDYGFDPDLIAKVESLLEKADPVLRGHLTQMLVLEPKEVLEPVLTHLDEITQAVEQPSERTAFTVIQDALANV
jgi:hypothetical protein